MGYVHYDRLSALDATFLALEDADVHMHVGSVAVFESGPLTAPDGGIDFARVRRSAGPVLARSRRLRQRLARIPLLDHPVWVDDDRFQLDYHLRHTALAAPGDERQLKRLAGRILSQKLDPHKPLWELWFVEGLEGDRFAVIAKIHHCMIDGIAGVDLMASLLSLDPAEVEAAAAEPPRYLPRPAPGALRLLADEALRRAALPLSLLRAGREAVAHPLRALDAASSAVASVAGFLGTGLAGSSPTPLNVDIGPHRRFDWTRFELAAVKEVKNRLGGTVNDVVLAVVAGAVRHFLQQRGVAVDDLVFRAQVPVNVRRAAERGALGNRVAMVLAPLPVSEPDRGRRYRRVMETMRSLKSGSQAAGAERFERLGDWTAKELLAAMMRLAERRLAFNIVVTNVPGPQQPVHLLGSRMLALHPVLPLFRRQAVGIALFSYDGWLDWGFLADWDALPDLHDLVRAVEREFEALRKHEPGRAP